MKNKISRRQFLQTAGASAAALLLASCSGNSASSVSSSSVASSEAASSAAASSEATSTVTTTGKTLVVYFSATGTTQGVAQTIADTVGADLFEVVPSDPYTSDDLNWTNNDSRVSREHNDEGLRAVALESTDVDGWDDYDTVFIGYPIWWGIAAWPMSSFVAVNDFHRQKCCSVLHVPFLRHRAERQVAGRISRDWKLAGRLSFFQFYHSK